MATSTYNSFYPGYYNFLRQRAGLSGTQVRPEDLEAIVRADLDSRYSRQQQGRALELQEQALENTKDYQTKSLEQSRYGTDLAAKLQREQMYNQADIYDSMINAQKQSGLIGAAMNAPAMGLSLYKTVQDVMGKGKKNVSDGALEAEAKTSHNPTLYAGGVVPQTSNIYNGWAHPTTWGEGGNYLGTGAPRSDWLEQINPSTQNFETLAPSGYLTPAEEMYSGGGTSSSTGGISTSGLATGLGGAGVGAISTALTGGNVSDMATSAGKSLAGQGINYLTGMPIGGSAIGLADYFMNTSDPEWQGTLGALTGGSGGATLGKSVGGYLGANEEASGAVGGALAGATTGASIGSSIFPGIGTVIGGALGGIGGAISQATNENLNPRDSDHYWRNTAPYYASPYKWIADATGADWIAEPVKQAGDAVQAIDTASLDATDWLWDNTVEAPIKEASNWWDDFDWDFFDFGDWW